MIVPTFGLLLGRSCAFRILPLLSFAAPDSTLRFFDVSVSFVFELEGFIRFLGIACGGENTVGDANCVFALC